tara:strand:- start:1494 stop:2474 length:981 start_codon:yes stop_codon:yes gene_type:complete
LINIINNSDSGDLMEFQLNLSDIPFNLENSLECGQVFRWKRENSWWVAVIDDRVVKLKQEDNLLNVISSSDSTNEEFIRKYLRINDPLPDILTSINRDHVMATAIHKLNGLRLIKQSPWECLASFICATYKNIIGIKNMISNICFRLGQRIEFEGIIYYTFPEAEIIASADRHTLEDCGLGYRAKFLLETANRIASREVILENLESAKYENVREILLENTDKGKILPGVGPKVADCVMLFSLEKLDAFPIDVWIRRTIQKYYPFLFDNDSNHSLSKWEGNSIGSVEYKAISKTMRKYFGSYAGYAQEYLFHYARESKLVSFTSVTS